LIEPRRPHEFIKIRYRDPCIGVRLYAVEGVVFYEPQFVKVTYEYLVRIDDDGNVVGEADSADSLKKCKRLVQKEEIQIRPNYDAPIAILNKPGWLSSGKLAVGLSDGVLQNVNSESTPQVPDFLASVSGAAKDIADFRAASGAVGRVEARSCNAGPRITGFARTKVTELTP
jgi:hypothetical protein